MSYLSPVDAAQGYFEPLGVEDDERPRCDPADVRADQRERFDRLEDARERFERSRDDRDDDRCGDRDEAIGFERFESGRLENPAGPRPLPRL